MHGCERSNSKVIFDKVNNWENAEREVATVVCSASRYCDEHSRRISTRRGRLRGFDGEKLHAKKV
jgi:hypothetical protein